MWSVGFAAFATNAVQFGNDQLQDLSARDSFLFIHWLLLTQFIGVGLGKLAWSVSADSYYVYEFLSIRFIYPHICDCNTTILVYYQVQVVN